MHGRRAAVIGITTLIVLSLLSTTALADYYYLGTGWWNKTTMTFYSYATGDYASISSTAASDWSNSTHAKIQSTAQGYEDISVFAGDFGSTIWYARTIICGVSGTCYSSSPINETYRSAEVDYNSNANIMGGLAFGAKQAVADHEFGHTLSLAHVPTYNPAHIMYTYPTYIYNTYGVNWPQSDDIQGINARY